MLCTDIYFCTGTVQFRLSEEEVFSVEELLGMIFSHGKKQAEDFTEQKIKVVFSFLLRTVDSQMTELTNYLI